MFVCIEGIDGCGKSTHSAALTKTLKAKFFKFPNKETHTGKLIYAHLERKWGVTVKTEGREDLDTAEERAKFSDSLVFQALQLTNRMEVAGDLVKAAGAGNVVLDRYWPSGYAYGSADGIDSDYLIKIHEHLPQPDLFLLLDIDVGDSSQRRPERRDRYEDDQELLKKVAHNYRILWANMQTQDAVRWKTIDARGSSEQTAEQVNQAIIEWREGKHG